MTTLTPLLLQEKSDLTLEARQSSNKGNHNGCQKFPRS
jgi:hypothetical protein